MNYQLYVRNYSRNTNYEIVATVDGLDVLNGKQGSLNNNGYIVNAGDSLAIKGFRKDKHTEAAFQFANVADSYAANSAQGDVRNTGVIGFAAFELQGPAKTRCRRALDKPFRQITMAMRRHRVGNSNLA